MGTTVSDEHDQETEPVAVASEADSPDAPLLLEPQQGDLEHRYEVRDALGRGGMGQVLLTRDRTLGRLIAVKTLTSDVASGVRRSRFLAEARITSQLSHPGVPPIHDLFSDPDGGLYYSMKLIKGQTLSEIIEALRAEEPDAVERYNLVRLLTIFLNACQAVAYAHTRHVVHRDLKPENIMIGDFGEVLVLDWGLARMLEEQGEQKDPELAAETGAGVPTIDDPIITQEGAIVGSPAYMSPESQEGDSSLVNAASDVYSLGILLYELLTLHRPFEAESLPRLLYLKATAEFTPPSQSRPDREIPEEVERICLKAMSLQAEDRYRNAGLLTSELENYLEGVRPRLEADRLVRVGLEQMVDFAEKARASDDADLRAMALRSELDSWDPLEIKRLAWQAEQTAEDTMAVADEVFGSCEAAFSSALSHVRDYRPARIGLADLYWLRFLQAEAGNDPRWMRRCQELIERFAPGRYERRLRGNGSISVMSTPLGATATLYPMVECDGRREAGEPIELGTTLVSQHEVPMGGYLLRLQSKGYAALDLPVVLGRMQDLMIDVELQPGDSLQEGFIHIAAGPVVLGADPAALSGFSETFVDLPDYAIARYPVTTAEYLEFVACLWKEDPAAARKRLPRSRSAQHQGGEPLFELESDGNYSLPITDRDGRVWQASQPMVSITVDDACAYARWLSQPPNTARFRLPTESEWEKAARGADRRIFPWGDRFDATYCVMSESSAEPPGLLAVGAAATDISPYGVRDLAGGVRDWVQWDKPGEAPADRSPIRGGSYGTVAVYSRCTSRTVVPRSYLGSHVGFRLVQELASSA